MSPSPSLVQGFTLVAHCSAICFLIAQEISAAETCHNPCAPATAGVDASTEHVYWHWQQQTPEFSKPNSLQDIGLDVMPSKRSHEHFAAGHGNTFSPKLVSCHSHLLRLSPPVEMGPVCL